MTKNVDGGTEYGYKVYSALRLHSIIDGEETASCSLDNAVHKA